MRSNRTSRNVLSVFISVPFLCPWCKAKLASLNTELRSGLMLFCQTICLMNAMVSHRLAKYAQ